MDYESDTLTNWVIGPGMFECVDVQKSEIATVKPVSLNIQTPFENWSAMLHICHNLNKIPRGGANKY